MKEYSFSEARQNFASVLDEARREGVVCIEKSNGEAFYVKPVMLKKSPLDVENVDLDISSSEIVDMVRAGRERNHR